VLGIGLNDVIATFAGVRPVIGSGKVNPSEESRDHVIWEESGLLTVTGGKLTTFRLVALEVLEKARKTIDIPDFDADMRVLNQVDRELLDQVTLAEDIGRRLSGRYGADVQPLLDGAQEGELEPILDTTVLWAELRWAAHAEGVVHLDDLLLRRLRLGLIVGNPDRLPCDQIRSICQEELGWDDARWETEVTNYRTLWRNCYSLPPDSTIPDWKELLEIAQQQEQGSVAIDASPAKQSGSWGLAAVLAALTLVLAIILGRRKFGQRRSNAN
jgi:glycerol-3-phosphate dehydrogenase